MTLFHEKVRSYPSLSLKEIKHTNNDISPDLIEFLSRSYHTRPQNEAPTPTYSPSLAPLYTHYITALIDICTPFTSDPTEIAYVAAARWPGFVAPVIAEWEAKVQEREQELSEDGGGEDGMRSGPRLEPPTEEERVRLIRLFSASVTQALERLYPRLESATSWRNRHHPPPTFRLSQIFSVTSIPPSSGVPPTTGDKTVTESEKETDEDWQTRDLPLIARFVLVASFLASHNPAKTDLRMLGHTQETSGRGRGRGRGRKRKVGAGVGRPTKAGGVKVRRAGHTNMYALLTFFGFWSDITEIIRSYVVFTRSTARHHGCPADRTRRRAPV